MATVLEQKVQAYKSGMGEMKELLPGVIEAYHQFTGSCFEAGALGEKDKQLIALGISLYANNEVCIGYHLGEAVSKGATREQILEAVAVAGAVGGAGVMSQGVTRVLDGLKLSAR